MTELPDEVERPENVDPLRVVGAIENGDSGRAGTRVLTMREPGPRTDSDSGGATLRGYDRPGQQERFVVADACEYGGVGRLDGRDLFG